MREAGGVQLPFLMSACFLRRSRVDLPWAVNYATVQPGGGALTAAVGDAPEALLLDWATGKTVRTSPPPHDSVVGSTFW